MRTSGFMIIISVALTWSCKTSSVSSSSGSYSEDLSVWRPALLETEETGEPADHSNEPKTSSTKMSPSGDLKNELNQVNALIVEQNKALKYVDGYTIQVYTGSSRETAMEAKGKVNELNPDLKPSVQYHQPNYKVKVGQYTDRLKAHEIFESLKKEFPQALLIPERIYVNYE